MKHIKDLQTIVMHANISHQYQQYFNEPMQIAMTYLWVCTSLAA